MNVEDAAEVVRLTVPAELECVRIVRLTASAVATRFAEPERISPTAKMPARLVSRIRRRGSEPPVSTKPRLSRATPVSFSQALFGSAPMKRKR